MNIKATGLLTKSSSGETLDAYFPVIKFNDQKTDIQDINTAADKNFKIVVYAILSYAIFKV